MEPDPNSDSVLRVLLKVDGWGFYLLFLVLWLDSVQENWETLESKFAWAVGIDILCLQFL